MTVLYVVQTLESKVCIAYQEPPGNGSSNVGKHHFLVDSQMPV